MKTMKTVEEFLKKILKKVGNFNNSRVFLRIFLYSFVSLMQKNFLKK